MGRCILKSNCQGNRIFKVTFAGLKVKDKDKSYTHTHVHRTEIGPDKSSGLIRNQAT